MRYGEKRAPFSVMIVAWKLIGDKHIMPFYLLYSRGQLQLAAIIHSIVLTHGLEHNLHDLILR